MQTIHWINNSTHRYYIASIYKDLLGYYIVATANGGIRNKLGAFRIHVFASEQEQLNKFNAINKARKLHKYTMETHQQL